MGERSKGAVSVTSSSESQSLWLVYLPSKKVDK